MPPPPAPAPAPAVGWHIVSSERGGDGPLRVGMVDRPRGGLSGTVCGRAASAPAASSPAPAAGRKEAGPLAQSMPLSAPGARGVRRVSQGLERPR
jgi:hypothetical protein